MDVEQIELNIAQQPTEHINQSQQIQNTSQPLNQLREDARQSHFLKKGKLQFLFLRRMTRGVLIYRIMYVVLCLIPFYKCPFSCDRTVINILLLVCVGLEMIKIIETIYQLKKIQTYLDMLGWHNAQILIPFSSNDFQTMFTLRYALDKFHRVAFHVRVTINVVWFLFYIVYTILFFIEVGQIISNEKNIIIFFMLIIFCLDSIFFIFPHLFNALCFLSYQSCQCIKRCTSKNNKLIRSLNSQKYQGGTKLTEENICIICWDEFKQNDQYTRLKCNSNHIFHTPCIKVWVKTNITCPVCRAQLV